MSYKIFKLCINAFKQLYVQFNKIRIQKLKIPKSNQIPKEAFIFSLLFQSVKNISLKEKFRQ